MMLRLMLVFDNANDNANANDNDNKNDMKNRTIKLVVD